MPRGRTAEKQEEVEGNSSQAWAEGVLEPGPQPGDAIKDAFESAAPPPAQPHLPGMAPTLESRVEAVIKHLEEEIGAIQDRQRKGNDKADAEVAWRRRDAETQRTVLELLREKRANEAANSPEAPPWPANPVDGAEHKVAKDGWEHHWTYRTGAGWQLDPSRPVDAATGKVVYRVLP